jgi:hypothetical protein
MRGGEYADGGKGKGERDGGRSEWDETNMVTGKGAASCAQHRIAHAGINRFCGGA